MMKYIGPNQLVSGLGRGCKRGRREGERRCRSGKRGSVRFSVCRRISEDRAQVVRRFLIHGKAEMSLDQGVVVDAQA